ncbi:MAG: CotH kinase family protein [Bacteroidetes bacterium]|nr:CotH kinase family protein [Bacteroidota bacterium]
MDFKKNYTIVLIIFLLNLSVFNLAVVAQKVVINEVMASNKWTISDEDGDFPDWIEIYNAGEIPVNLENWGISDDTIDQFKWIFPEIILNPTQYLLVFASGKDRRNSEYLHTNFRIKSGLDPVVLFDSKSNKIDEYSPVCIPSNISLGYKPDGSGEKYYFTNPSPGFTNNENSIKSIRIVEDTLFFSHDGGHYSNIFELEISKTSDSTRIFYSTDGSIPDEESFEYLKPITIKSKIGEENEISEISTGPFWKPPKDEVFKVNVIRAVAINDGCPSSNIVTNTYFIGNDIFRRYPVTLISISTEKNSFFGNKKGIYVAGINKNGEGRFEEGNYSQSGSEWERPVHLEFFNTNGSLAFEQDVGVRIHGRGSRNASQKTLKVYSRAKYGKERINYKIFQDKDINSFHGFLIRTTLGDISKTFFKDELCHELVKELNMDIQAFRPSVVFINGEYWGIHNLRERVDKYYIENNHNRDPENLDMIAIGFYQEEVIEGDNLDYHALINFIAANNIQDPKNYEYIKSKIDINNYIDYYISQLYFANFDWPDSNMKYWHSRTDDSKWRWLFYDCDWCFVKDSYNHLVENTIDDDRYYVFRESATFLFRSLLKNKEFRDQFYARFIYLLNSTFEPGLVISKIEEFKEIYSPLIIDHMNRWNEPKTYIHWLENVEGLKYFAIKRPAILLNQLIDNFDIPYTIFPNPVYGTLYIQTNLPDEVNHRIEIFNALGKVEYSRTFGNTSELVSNPVSVASFSRGIYFIKIQYGNLIFHSKLIILDQ